MRKSLYLLILLLLTACAALPGAEPTPTPAPAPAFVRKVPFGVIQVLVNPETVTAANAAGHITPNDLVMGMTINGEHRAYPIGLMRRYEIANDILGGEPIAVTFCPSCNTGLSFSRLVNGQELVFDFSGMILDEAMVMKDRQSETLWSQVRLQAVQGDLEGERLELLASNQMTWQEWVAEHPDTTLIIDPRLPARANDFGIPVLPDANAPDPDAYHGYVAGIARENDAAAFPLDVVQAQGAVNSEVEGLSLLLVGLGEPGAVAVWERTVNGQTLTFTMNGAQLVDNETGSIWNPATGIAESGELAGAQLTPADVWISDWRGWLDAYPNSTLELL